MMSFLLFVLPVVLAYEGKENAIPITLDVLANQTNSAVKLPVYYSFSLSRVSFVQVTATPDPLISPSTLSLQIDLIDNNDTFYSSAGTTAGANLSALLLPGNYLLYMPNANPAFTLLVATAECGDGSPAPTNLTPETALAVPANRTDPLVIWICPPTAPSTLFYRVESPDTGSLIATLATEQQRAPIFGATLSLGSTQCGGGGVAFSSSPSCSVALNTSAPSALLRVSRPAAVAGGRLTLSFQFDNCAPDRLEPNGYPPASVVAETGSRWLDLSLCNGDHDFFQLPSAPGKRVALLFSSVGGATPLLRFNQIKASSHVQLRQGTDNFDLPLDDAPVFLEISSGDGRGGTSYNLTVSVGSVIVVDFEPSSTASVALPAIQQILNSLPDLVPIAEKASPASMELVTSASIDTLRSKLTAPDVAAAFGQLGLKIKELRTAAPASTSAASRLSPFSCFW